MMRGGPGTERSIRLLRDVLAVFESELPTSKANTDARIEEKWSRSRALEAEKRRLRDYYDDFCIEVNLISVQLESRYTALSSSDALWEIVKPLMEFLESLVPVRLGSHGSRSSFPYPCLRALRAKLKKSQKQKQPIAQLDFENSGLVEFSIDSPDHERSLNKLSWCRKKIVKLADFADSSKWSIEPTGYKNEYPVLRDAVSAAMKNHIQQWVVPQIGSVLGTFASSMASCPEIDGIGKHLAAVSLSPTESRSTFLIAFHCQTFESAVVEIAIRRYPRVRFSQDDPDHRSRIGEDVLECERLCHVLSMCASNPVHSAWELGKKSDPTPIRWQARSVRASHTSYDDFYSLERILEMRYSSWSETKLPLMIHLAQCFLELANKFPLGRKYKQHILFPGSCPHDREMTVELRQPFLEVSFATHLNEGLNFDEASIEEIENSFQSRRSFLELGVLLLEIQYESPIEELAKQGAGLEPRDHTMYDDYVTAWTVIETPYFNKTVPRNIAAAIRACLRYEFSPIEFGPASPTLHNLAYQNIVRPLELQELLGSDEAHTLSDSDEDEENDTSQKDADTISRDQEASFASPILFTNPPTNGSQKWRVFDEQPLSDAKLQLADKWFERLSDFHGRIIVPLLQSPQYDSTEVRRTKVAVLDTGIDLRDPFIKGAKSRIKEMRNWVANEKGKVDVKDVADSYGHGTHVAALVLKVAPCADVCVGRIASGKSLENGETYVAEAIIWAYEICKADIITMSFGFPRSSDIVAEAIMGAYGKGTLMFAATRNDGGNREIAYPASHRNVIGIFSTDGDGNKSGFNPNPPEGDDSYFSTLGEAVESSWPKHLRQEGQQGSTLRKSGTSFATPIAGAMAANVLDYAKLQLDMGEKRMKRLHEVERMLAVLKLMAPKKRDGYRYLAPWLLWKADEYAVEEELEVERNAIRTDILKILMK